MCCSCVMMIFIPLKLITLLSTQPKGWLLWLLNAKKLQLLAIIVLSAVQSSAQTFIHNAILFIDTSNNAWYNRAYCLIGTPYLLIIASDVIHTQTISAVISNRWIDRTVYILGSMLKVYDSVHLCKQNIARSGKQQKNVNKILKVLQKP